MLLFKITCAFFFLFCLFFICFLFVCFFHMKRGNYNIVVLHCYILLHRNKQIVHKKKKKMNEQKI